MSLVKANGAGEVSTGFYNGVATQSLRFDDGSDTYLYNEIDSTPSSTTQTTVSFWVKRASIGDNIIFCGYTSAPNVAHYINFNSADKLVIYLDKTAGGSDETSWNSGNMVFRDTTNFYHILVQYDVGQASNDNKVKVYVNGSQITLTVSQTGSAVTAHRLLNSGIRERWGNYFNSGADFDGYLAEVNVIDGQVVSQNSFGETKDGVWIAKKYTGSYGNNGYRLQFKETGDGQSTASSSTIGADTSGNNHHFQDYNFDAHDSNMPDSPENNFATFNSLEPSGGTLAEGNLKFTGKTGVGAGYYATRATFGMTSGKWYFEGLATDDDSEVGIGTASASLDNYLGGDAHAYGYAGFNGQKYNNNSGSSYGATFGNGDIIGVAFDADNGTLTFYKNGATQGTAFTSLTATPYFPMVGETAQSSPITTHLNFGADSSFSGNKTAQNNTDGNGVGDFYYTPPSGYLALCSANLDDVTIGPNSTTQAGEHFNSLLWTGTGSSADAKTGVGFQPDWLWAKDRNYANNHILIDSSRGVTKYLQSSQTSAEITDSNVLQSFDSDGFTTVGQGINYLNVSDYVAWLWKANGGTTSSNTQGTVTSTVQANTTAGFSIIQYAGTGSALSYGHGLTERPTFYIVKDRDASLNWFIQYFDGSSDYYLAFNTVSTSSLSGFTPDATKMNYGSSSTLINQSGRNYIVYAFHSVEGYSKIGTYTGNGSTDGAFVYTGFRPAFVLLKQLNSSGSWLIHDNKRSPFNVIDEDLFANLASAESDNGVDKDFLSNGFKHKSSHSAVNGSGSTYVYLAFAEQPYKFSNAR